MRLGGGAIAIESIKAPEDGYELPKGSKSLLNETGQTISWSEDFACPDHGAFMPELSPRVFSFNSPLGACGSCQGLGVQRQFNTDLVVDMEMSISNGCVRPWKRSMSPSWYRRLLEQVAEYYDIPSRTVQTII